MSLTNNYDNVTRPAQNQPAKRHDIYNLDLLDLVRRKAGLIIFFVLVGIGLSLLYFFKAPKTYESTSKIFVDEKNAPSMNGGGDQSAFMSEISMENYLQKLKSTLILQPAIASGKFKKMETFEASEQDTDDILFKLREGKAYRVTPADTKSSSGVMKLSFKGPDPEECKQVLESIVASFEDHIRDTTKNVGGENADLVQRAQENWLDRLKVVEQEIEGLMVRPELLNIDGRIINPYQLQLSLMHQELHDLRSQRNKVLARVESVKQDQLTGVSSADLIAQFMSETSTVSETGYVRTNEELLQLKIEEKGLLNEYGGDHPELRSVRLKIAAVEKIIATELAAMQSGSRKSGSSTRPNIVQDFYQKMDRNAKLLITEEKQIEAQIAGLQQQSTSVSALVEKLNSLQRERERLEAGYQAVVDKMSEMSALKEHLWRTTSILDPPSNAEVVAPSLPISLAAGLFLGSLAGLGFAGFKDMAEKTFRSSDAVGEVLNARVIGHVSLFEKTRHKKRNPKFPNAQPELITLHAPASQASESYRAIRTALFFKARETNAKVVQVTSPAPGDGKSTTTANLATTISQAGSRVLLLDADMRKPTQHKLFGLENQTGLSSIITGSADLKEVVQEVIPGYLSVVTAGPIPANPAELLTSTRFADLLAEYRKDYDYVLIDTPPMLAVTDPSIVCALADLVYMVMRIRKGIRTNSIRAKETIDSMGIELGGIIINGLRRRDRKAYEYSGQYGYGANTYGQTGKAIAQTTRPSRKVSRPHIKQ